MGDMLSQAEIDALLNGTFTPDKGESVSEPEESLTSQEIDALGEIGNICMGTSATTLFTLLGKKVLITTPVVTVTSWNELENEYTTPYVAVEVHYTDGLVGSNLMILKEDDVKVITDLMMGGSGVDPAGALSDLHLSAISEAMNQMIGSSATSMSSMFSKRIDISPPKSFVMDFNSPELNKSFDKNQKVAKIAFKMVIDNLIDSEIMQILPIKFAKELVDSLLNASKNAQNQSDSSNAKNNDNTNNQPGAYQSQPANTQPAGGYIQPQTPPVSQPQNFGQMNNSYDNADYEHPRNMRSINVQPAQFEAFDDGKITVEKKNISLIMDVPLEVTVELGRTRKPIKDILEFAQGSIIELDKLAGDPVDILVNGKVIAKGEVVVIDESFGVKILNIIQPSKRL